MNCTSKILLLLLFFLSAKNVTASVAVPPIPGNTTPGTVSSPGPVLGSRTVTLDWSAASGATTYGVAVRDLVTNVLVVDTTTSSSSFTVTLSAGKPYRWNVNACNSSGCSSFTTPLHFQTPGSGPTISSYSFTTTPTANQNFDGTINGTGFVIGGTQVLFCVNGSSSCFQHPSAGVNVTSSTRLTVNNVNLGAGSYQIVVQTSAGSSTRSSAFTVGSISIPPIPSNTSPGTTSSPGPILSSSTVTLDWSASSGATTYGVAVRDLVTNVLVVDTNTSSSSLTVNLSPGRPYRWNVNACNSAGCSNFTTVLHFQTPGTIPPVPTNTTPGTVSSPGPILASRTVTLDWSAASGATTYGVAVRDLVSNVLVVDTTTSSTSFTVTLTAGKPYRWNVNACNGSGCSSFTTPLHFQTPGSGPTISSYSFTTTPTANQNFNGTINGSGFVIGGTQVLFCVNGSSSCFQHPSAGVSVNSSTSLNVSNVNLGAGSYQIVVQTSAGSSARSTPFTVGTIGIPPIPINMSPGTISSPGPVLGSSSVTLSWAASSTATSYGIAVRDLVTNLLVVDTTTNSPSTTVNLSPGKPYRWNVNACNSAGCSSFTTPIHFQTPTIGGPVISSISPNSYLPSNSNQLMTIRGSNFLAGATLTFDPPTGTNINSTATKLTFVSGTQIDYQINNGSDVGVWMVRVNNPNGQVSNWASFTVTGLGTPTVSGFTWNTTPTHLQNFSGVITGSGFVFGGTRVFFCVNATTSCFEHPQSGVVVNSANNLSVSNVNLGSGSYQIFVQTASGPSNRSSAFTVSQSPSAQPMLTVSPTSGALGTVFRFTGTNFTRNSIATLNVTRPNSTAVASGRYGVDSSGNVSFNITSQSSDVTGPWTFSLRDDLGKQASATAQYTSSQPSGTDAMSFVADVTIPDNSQIAAGSSFTKKWQLRNVGTTTWTNYSAVFISAPSNNNPSVNLSVNGASTVSIPSTDPNQTVEVSISMKALTPGTYYSYWQLRNASGTRFGVQFYVKIRVVPQQGNALGFGNQSGRSGTNDSIQAYSGRNADPVNTATGNYNYEATDLRVPGRGLDVEFSRSYNSQDNTPGPLGNGWSHSFNIYLTEITPGSASVHYSDGKVLAYVNETGTSNFKSSYPGYYDSLNRNADGTWTLKKPDQRTYQFDASGKLITIEDHNQNRIQLTYNGSNLTQVTDTVGRTFDLAYSGSSLTSLTDPIGRVLRFNYDSLSNLTSFEDARGTTNTYEYDSASRLTRIVDGRKNNLLVNTYDASNRVATQTNGRGNRWLFVYNADGSTSVFDPLSHATNYLHDTNFNMERTVDRNSSNQNVLYDESNNRAQVSDPNNNYSSFAYDGKGNITSRTNPALNSSQAVYDAKNNPTQITDEVGSQTQLSYDANGNLLSLTDALTNSSSVTYDQFGQPLTLRDAKGNDTVRTYDAQGNLTSVKDALNNTTTYTYDAVGRRLSMKDARGNTTRYTYDENDNLLSLTDPLGNVVNYTYDGNNNRISMRDARGNVTTYTYNENNLLIKETDAKGNFIEHTYDKLDRRISTRDKRANVTQFAYDNEGRLLTQTNPLGNATRYAYDANGNRTQVRDAKGQSTLFSYDVLNRVTKVQDALGNIIQKEYDAAGRLTKETDPQGNATQFSYDAIGNLIRVTDASGGIARYTYDKNHNRITQTDPRNQTSNLAYDKLNRLISTSNPLSQTYSYTFDAVGNRASQTDARNQITRYSYDGNNRLSTITYPDNSTVQITYDANGNITQMVDAVGTSKYTYDELNRVVVATDPFLKTINYQYDASGNIIRMTYPDGKDVTYQYDAVNRLASFTDWAGKTTSYQYDSTNLLTRVTYPNGVITNFLYDFGGRMTTKTDSGISSYIFTLDRNGNRTKVSITQPLANRLPNTSHTYAYDAANRIQNAGPATFSFDANGNMTSKTEAGIVTSYTYDFENRLKSVSGGTQYSYNAQGVRLQKIEGGKTTRYVVDTSHDLSQVLCETDANGNITAYYVYGLGLAYKVDPNGTHYYYSFDPLGSTIAMTDDAKNVVNSYAYDPFGKVTNAVEKTANPFQFVGQFGVMQEGNGLLFIRARYYATDIGRFLTKDVIKGSADNPQNLNLYTYVNQNPVLNIDPSGALVFSLGVQGQAAWGIGAVLQAAIVADDQGNHGIAYSYGISGGSSVGFSAGGFLSITNDRTIDDLNGRSYSIDGGGGVLGHLNGSVLIGADGRVNGMGIGAGIGVEFQAGATVTWGKVDRLSRFEYVRLLIQLGPTLSAPLLAFDASVALRNYYSRLIEQAANERSTQTVRVQMGPIEPRGPQVGGQNPVGRPTKND